MKIKFICKHKKGLFLLIVVVFLLLFSTWWGIRTFVYPLKHFDIIKQESAKNQIDPYLVSAIIKAESGFNKDVTSPKQAKGLMQMMDSTAEEMTEDLDIDLTKDNIYDEKINIALGCKYLSSLITKYHGNYYLAIVAYNAGMGNLDNWIKEGTVSEDLDQVANSNIPFPETKNYLKKVIHFYQVYRMLY